MNNRKKIAHTALLTGGLFVALGCAFAEVVAPREVFAGLLSGASFSESSEVTASEIRASTEGASAQLDTAIADPSVKVPQVRAAVVADSHVTRAQAALAATDTTKVKRLRAELDTARRVVIDSIKNRPQWRNLTGYARKAIDNALAHLDRADSLAATLGVVAAPPPPDTVTPPPPPPPDTQPAPPPPPPTTAVCGQLIGWPLPTVAQMTALGGAWAEYEQKVGTRLDSQWALYGTSNSLWEIINYYDRAAIEYVRWCRTGDPKHRDRARAVAVDYRDRYWAAQPAPFTYNSSTYWSMPLGVALHYLDTKDPLSLRAIGYVAEWLVSVPWVRDIARTTALAKPASAVQSPSGAALPSTLTVGVTENRDRARILEIAVLAHVLSAPTGGPGSQMMPQLSQTTWAQRAGAVVDSLVKLQGADGTFRDVSSGGAVKPFMDGLLNTALILYYENVTPDPRIVTLIKRQLDYTWANLWLGASFGYYEWSYTAPENPDWSGSRVAAPDLNLLLVHGFAFLCERTGDQTYCDRGRTIFANGVRDAFMDQPKHLNQQGISATRALKKLSGVQ